MTQASELIERSKSIFRDWDSGQENIHGRKLLRDCIAFLKDDSRSMIGDMLAAEQIQFSPPEFCDHCGRRKAEAATNGSTHCVPPFTVQPHSYTGKHPADVLRRSS